MGLFWKFENGYLQQLFQKGKFNCENRWRRKMKVEEIYTKEGIELVKCVVCHGNILITRAGKFRGDWYCHGDYSERLEHQINEWKGEYRRWRNGKELITKSPNLSNFIN